VIKSLELNGVEYVILERTEYDQLKQRRPTRRSDRPRTVDAIQFTRDLLADRLAAALRRAGWTQVDLARTARVRPETISRIMNRRHTVDAGTWKRIDAAFRKAGVEA
jgi:ribosome-binding protein aMBF1 (putative translation factor)